MTTTATKFSPPAELPRYAGELTGTTPLTNDERFLRYINKARWSGRFRWFRAWPARGRKSHG